MKQYKLGQESKWINIEEGAATLWQGDKGNYYICDMDCDDLPGDAEEMDDREQIFGLVWDCFKQNGIPTAPPYQGDVQRAATAALGSDGYEIFGAFIEALDAGWDFEQCLEHAATISSYAAGDDPFNGDDVLRSAYDAQCEAAGIQAW